MGITMDRAESRGGPNRIEAGESAVDEQRLVDEAAALARALLVRSDAAMSRRERRRRDRLGRLLDDPSGRELVLALTDEVLRVEQPQRAAQRFAGIVRAHPTSAVGMVDRLMLRAGALVAPLLPNVVMPLVTRRITAETHGIVLSAADPAFAKHVERRRRDGVRLNVNPLGEAILSDAEAADRLALVRARIGRSDVDYVSVKISAVVANLDVLAFDQSIERITEMKN